MARNIYRLTTRSVQTIKAAGMHGDGGGLYLRVTHADVRGRTITGRSWIFRFTDPVTRKRRDAGLGPVWDVSLAAARARAAEFRDAIRRGDSPIVKAQRKRPDAMTFGACATAYIDAHKAGWRNAKHAAQWTATLTTYCKPITDADVAAVDTTLVLSCLQPQWKAKPETMTRVRQRMECVLDWATVRGYRTGDNPARWKGHLDVLLPRRSKVAAVEHRAAVPYSGMHDFMGELRKQTGLGALALELQILTATRPGEAAGAEWREFDLDAALWIIPGERMKAGHEHRVPLSAPVVVLLRTLPHKGRFVFPGVKGRPLTTAAAMATLRGLRPGVTAHGFRSSFRDWAGEETHYAREVVESALAHRIKDKAEAAYRRGDALARRTEVMQAWADYLDGKKV